MLKEIRPTRIEVNLDAVEHNYSALCAHAAPARVMPVVKADGYGHGALQCAARLESLGADFFGVAFLEEAIALRAAGIRSRILVMGGLSGRQISRFLEYDIELTASSVDKLRSIDAAAGARGTRAKVHLKIDTGMERIGVHYYSAEKLIEAAAAVRHSDIVGMYSHFARAEEEDLSFCRTQLERYQSVAELAQSRLPAPLERHVANSGGLIQFPESRLDFVRAGLAIYGVYPAPHMRGMIDLKPALRLRSELVFFKVVEAGAGVSYGHTWSAPRRTRIVTVPLGYGDGFPRRLSNCGEVLIRGRRYPIVGSVCMDQFMVDIGPDEAYNGDEVVLIGEQAGGRIAVGEIASRLDTDPREILCALKERIPRIYP